MKVFKTFLYWLVLCTWGIVSTLMGLWVFIVMKFQGRKSFFYKGAIVTY